MGAHSLLQRRKYSYVIRQRVPADLVPILGKREIVKTLSTLNPQEAKRRVRDKANEIDRMFQQARQAIDLSPEQAGELANRWLTRSLDEDARDRETGTFQLQPSTLATDAEYLSLTRGELARGDDLAIEYAVNEVLQSGEVAPSLTPDGRRRLSMALLRAQVALFERVAERNKGIWREDSQGTLQALSGLSSIRPMIPSSVVASNDNPRLSEVLARWLAERKPPPRTEIEWKTQHRRFREVVGEDLPVRAVTSGHVRAFKDALLRLPNRMPRSLSALPVPAILDKVGDDPEVARLSGEAVNKGLNAIASVLSFAQRNGYLETNVASRIKVERRGDDREKRLSYDDADLQVIFGSPLFTEAPTDPTQRGARYWLPILGLYMGARLEELGQALLADVREEAGHPYIDINTLDEGKRVKTKGSRRKVPLHPEVIRMGFLRYVEALRARGERQLFPELQRDNRGRMTSAWSKWWGRYTRRSLGITDPRKVFHSFRHTFKDACRRARIPEAIHDALTGHASPSVGRTYGSGEPVEVLAEEIAKVRYPGLPSLFDMR